MSARGLVPAVVVPVLALALVSCKTDEEGFIVRNGLDVPILVTTDEDPEAGTSWEAENFDDFGVEPGGFRMVTPRMDDPEPPWGSWPLSIWADPQCRDDLYVLVETEDGQRFVYEPPVCEDGEWTVSQ